MAKKDELSNMLTGESPRPTIRRGQGVRLSTEGEPPAPPPEQPVAPSQHRTNAPPRRGGDAVRVNRGYKLREDLIKACKRLALETDRPLYEVMEEALSDYLQRHGLSSTEGSRGPH